MSEEKADKQYLWLICSERPTIEELRGVIRIIHDHLADDKPIYGDYKDYLLEALYRIANGTRPDAAFKFRKTQKKPKKYSIIDAMQEIYNCNSEGQKITRIIQETADNFDFDYETLKAEWYKDDCRWKKAFDEYYEDMSAFYAEKAKSL